MELATWALNWPKDGSINGNSRSISIPTRKNWLTTKAEI